MHSLSSSNYSKQIEHEVFTCQFAAWICQYVLLFYQIKRFKCSRSRFVLALRRVQVIRRQICLRRYAKRMKITPAQQVKLRITTEQTNIVHNLLNHIPSPQLLLKFSNIAPSIMRQNKTKVLSCYRADFQRQQRQQIIILSRPINRVRKADKFMMFCPISLNCQNMMDKVRNPIESRTCTMRIGLFNDYIQMRQILLCAFSDMHQSIQQIYG